jgi:hypothetical protein
MYVIHSMDDIHFSGSPLGGTLAVLLVLSDTCPLNLSPLWILHFHVVFFSQFICLLGGVVHVDRLLCFSLSSELPL